MAGVIRSILFSTAKKIVNPSTSQFFIAKSPITCTKLSNSGILSRNVTRSLWYLSSNKDSPTITARLVPSTNRCGCGCQIHTEVDGEISKFLKEEINLEESSKLHQNLPKIKDFEVSKSVGSEIELVRKNENELITVKFNVNESVDSDHAHAPEGEGVEDQMVSKPNFTVELSKGDNNVLAIHCYFPPDDGMAEDGQEGEEHIGLFPYQSIHLITDPPEKMSFAHIFLAQQAILIQEIGLYSGEWNDSVYTLQADTMDGKLYDLIMDMLDDRGIDNEFVNQLVELSTIYEHSKYVGFLKDMKSFVDKN